ncbi:MAG TPA: GAF domain-containing protein [Gemmatimonadaceae bacterium]|nr:GAF domain-containing protein [Gemmatimonadaceae bacterium]
MAETTLDLRGVPKPEAYATLQGHIESVLEGVRDDIAAMATMSALIHHAFGFLWTGFYRVVEPGRLLRVGPYQGTLGCLDITFGRGVCGTAASERRAMLVRDVNDFPGHIVCDARAQSEVVIPVTDATGALLAVLDVDADRVAAFDQDDVAGLSRIVAWFAAPRPAAPPALG